MARGATVGLVLCLAVGATGKLAAQCPDGTPAPCAGQGPLANSVAVLVFENRARDSSLTLLAEGLADEITTDLGRIRRLDVRSSASVRTVLGRGAREPRRIGQALNARYLVDGAMLPGASRVRIDVQLVEAATGRVRWTSVYQRPTEDLFGLIAAVSDSVALAIVGELAPAERAALAARPTGSSAAYDAFLRAEALSRRVGFRNLRHAVTGYEDAIALDSGFAAAWAGLAWVWTYHDEFYPSRVVYPLARRAADRALALDSTLTSALNARSEVATWFDWDYAWGERLARTALAREPRNARAHLSLAFALIAEGRLQEAAAESRLALSLDSLDLNLVGDAAEILLCSGHASEAEAAIRMGRNVSGDSLTFGKWVAAEVLLSQGRCGPSAPGVAGVVGVACRGGPEAGHRAADSLAAASTRGTGAFMQALWLAMYYGASGDREATLHWLERAFEERAFFGLIAVHPLFAFVRSDPRFQALVRAAHVPPRTEN